MPRKTVATDNAAVAPARAAKPKTTRTVSVVEAVSTPRVKSVKHSKAVSPVVSDVAVETVTLSAHDQIAKIAYGYWEARGFQAGCAEQDWLRAEREYQLQA